MFNVHTKITQLNIIIFSVGPSLIFHHMTLRHSFQSRFCQLNSLWRQHEMPTQLTCNLIKPQYQIQNPNHHSYITNVPKNQRHNAPNFAEQRYSISRGKQRGFKPLKWIIKMDGSNSKGHGGGESVQIYTLISTILYFFTFYQSINNNKDEKLQ